MPGVQAQVDELGVGVVRGTARSGPGCRRGCRRAGGTPARRRTPRRAPGPTRWCRRSGSTIAPGPCRADSGAFPVCMSVYCSGRWMRYFAPTSVSSLASWLNSAIAFVQRLLALVQPGEHGAAADLQAALVQLVTQLLRILRQETLRAELGPDVTGVGDVVQVLLPADLVRRPWRTTRPRSRAPCPTEAGKGRGSFRNLLCDRGEEGALFGLV